MIVSCDNRSSDDMGDQWQGDMALFQPNFRLGGANHPISELWGGCVWEGVVVASISSQPR
jgi:hypothetical protein